ncbi:MAG TPA: hypothetical protein VIQ54_18980 [Polyangia bacterium]|jgi:hypothetical protein
MSVLARWSRLGAALVVAAAAGCGPSGSGGGGGSGGNGGGGGSAGGASGDVFTWKESGTLHVATIAGASRVRSAASDAITIIGGDAAGTAVTTGMATAVPPLMPGSFACGPSNTTAPFALLSYSHNGSGQTECTFVLSTLGETTGSRATGTFSGSVPLESGGSAVITEGVFDVMLTVNNL